MNPTAPKPSQYSDGITKAQEYFQKEKLDLPFIPPDEKQKIVEFQGDVFGSKPNSQSLYDIQAFVNEVLSKPVEDYVMLGFAGHGVESRGIHYYASKGNLALFIQLKYGGAFDDEEATRDRINGIFHMIGYLFESIESAKKAKLIPKDKRLLIVESDFYGKGWGWIDGCPGEVDKSQWHTEAPRLLDALNDIPTKD